MCKNLVSLLIICTVIILSISLTQGVAKHAKKNLFKPNKSVMSFKCVDNIKVKLCEGSKGFPMKKIKSKLMREKNLIKQKFFGNVIEPMDESVKLQEKYAVIDDQKEKKNVCKTRSVTVFPKVAEDANKQLRFVVNTEKYRQSIRIELCIKENADCFGSNNILDYAFMCSQLYSNIKLLYLTETGNLQHGQFPIPTACVCTYQIN